ncbi:hypothetical protein [Lewinella sp. IMCC34183]|uniref:hypothetical protein n=1 Tax=Lewinella sp. IMCC34183 TaxID=2248762 RepID=UPI000E265D90|nr:hypothetical protein [Lewinella sp. IMCC34183]
MRLSPHSIALFLLLVLGSLGWVILDDYGISWDEAIQRGHGRVSIDYASEKLGLDRPPLAPQHDLDNYQWSNYGMLYQLIATPLELALGLQDDPFAYYRLRHVLSFALYLVALVCFYRSLQLRWPGRSWYPLMGTAMLVLSPRIFAHAFFNPKDHILLVFYLISTYTLLRLLRYRTWRAFLWHAFATALALNTRLPALLVLAATVGLLVTQQALDRPRGRRGYLMALLYPILSLALMIPFFPYLWQDTLHRLWGALTEMSAFDWGGYNLLFGDRLWATDVPGYYIPAWILITTPLLYLPFLLTGLGLSVVRLVRGLRAGRPWSDYGELCDLTQLGLSVGPILVVIVLHSTLYNGWRHMHFVYPGLVFLGVGGFAYVRERVPRIAPALLAGGLLLAAYRMICGHPHQYVYFNELIQGDPVMARFDMDYWGVGFRDALTHLAETVPEGEVRKVHCNNWPCRDNLQSLPANLRPRLQIESTRKYADYFATNFQDEDKKAAFRHEQRYAEPVVEIAPCGQLSIGIYRVQPLEE